MCKLGDIIVVSEFKDETGKTVPKHSFVVINDNAGTIETLNYDFVSNIMCSLHNEEHRMKKLKYEENLEIKDNMIIGNKINSKRGYIKADQLFYFDKKKIKYKVLAHVDPELLDELVQLIIALDRKGKVKNIIDNIYEDVV